MSPQLSPSQQEVVTILRTHGSLSRSQIAALVQVPVSLRTLTRDLKRLTEAGIIIGEGVHLGRRYRISNTTAANGDNGDSSDTTVVTSGATAQPPVQPWWQRMVNSDAKGGSGDQLVNVSVQVRNPLSVLVTFLKKLLTGDAMSFTVHIKTIYVLLFMSTLLLGAGAAYRVVYELGKSVGLSKIPAYQYLPNPNSSPSPTPDPWRQTAFTGLVQYSYQGDRYFLFTADSEAILLNVPATINLSNLIGRRIFAAGNYHSDLKVLEVVEASSLEILPIITEPLPTVKPSPSPIPEP